MRNEKVKKIWEDYGEDSFHYLLSILHNKTDAEDVLENCFLKIIRHQKHLFLVKNLKSYLFAVARNEARDFIKSQIKGRKKRDDMMGLFLESRNENIPFEEIEKVNLALSNLPDEQKEIVVLKIWEGFTFKEIGKILKTSPDTCASRYRYALDKLKKELKR